jgi:sugar O-acyltransferase (sialic acid O-acetyltransferase NeuD family)
MPELIVLGNGGHAREIAAITYRSYGSEYGNHAHKLKFVDKADEDGLLGVEAPMILGMGDVATRRKLIDKFALAQWTTLIHCTSSMAADIGAGCVIQAGAVATTAVTIGKNCLVNVNVSIGHDAVLGENVVVCPLVAISGYVTIGDDVMIGAGAVILPQLTIGDGATIGAGAVVTHDISAGETWIGNPARRYK